jgi:hypothetical protein
MVRGWLAVKILIALSGQPVHAARNAAARLEDLSIVVSRGTRDLVVSPPTTKYALGRRLAG